MRHRPRRNGVAQYIASPAAGWYSKSMCTVVILRRPEHRWPILIAANRDEMLDRPWSPPARHWPDRAEVVAGRDELAGGTWLGVNDHGLVAAVMNRPGSLGPADDKRSRGELVLEALDHADAARRRRGAGSSRPERLPALQPCNCRTTATPCGCAAIPPGRRPHRAFILPEGLSMLTSHDRNDLTLRPYSALSPTLRGG